MKKETEESIPSGFTRKEHVEAAQLCLDEGDVDAITNYIESKTITINELAINDPLLRDYLRTTTESFFNRCTESSVGVHRASSHNQPESRFFTNKIKIDASTTLGALALFCGALGGIMAVTDTMKNKKIEAQDRAIARKIEVQIKKDGFTPNEVDYTEGYETLTNLGVSKDCTLNDVRVVYNKTKNDVIEYETTNLPVTISFTNRASLAKTTLGSDPCETLSGLPAPPAPLDLSQPNLGLTPPQGNN